MWFLRRPAIGVGDIIEHHREDEQPLLGDVLVIDGTALKRH